MKIINFSSLVTILIVLDYASALYFHIAEGERKCFIEEIPDDTTVIINYKVELFDPRSGGFMPSSPGIGMHVEVRNPNDLVVLSRVYSSEKMISFTSTTPGEHVLCICSNSPSWFSGSQLRMHLDIQVGEHAVDYANVAQKDKLSELQLRIRQLLNQVHQITMELSYQRVREEKFRHTSESTNSTVLCWSLLQTGVLVAIGYWQMRHLKSSFEANSLNKMFANYMNKIPPNSSALREHLYLKYLEGLEAFASWYIHGGSGQPREIEPLSS